MPPMFNAKPADASIFETAPVKLKATFEIDQPAAKVWDDLTNDTALHWCRILEPVEWTSPKPYGVGTTRIVRSLKGLNVFHEEFFRWEEGRQKSFFVAKTSGPLFDRFAEDYLVEPRGDDACTFTWTIALEPKLLAKPGTPVNKAILKTLFTDTRKFYGLS